MYEKTYESGGNKNSNNGWDRGEYESNEKGIDMYFMWMKEFSAKKEICEEDFCCFVHFDVDIYLNKNFNWQVKRAKLFKKNLKCESSAIMMKI